MKTMREEILAKFTVEDLDNIDTRDSLTSRLELEDNLNLRDLQGTEHDPDWDEDEPTTKYQIDD